MSAIGTVLVTGGTGQTGRVVTDLLHRRGVYVIVASRNHPREPLTPGVRHLRFDWADPATHDDALREVDSIYLLPPPLDADPVNVVDGFLRRARDAGVRRTVLLNSSAFPLRARGLHAVRLTVQQLPEWSVLLASGFMQNFVGTHPTAVAVRERHEIVAAAGDGRTGWIDAADVAAVAAELLTRADHDNREHVLTGPEALAYDDMAATIAAEWGLPVRYRPVTAAERTVQLTEAGLPRPFVDALVGADVLTASGAEDRVTTEVAQIAGRAATSFAEFVRRHRG
ncbi:NAD-dependent epimerase/dehydratase family protein [Qaidamihabitans albus]|uniref:NAD-dependent epimerase/dehydratase family protein n=1 Tax=Qaidamihabitans albus TaxID=2795733 RepID=UPI0018F21270|nr:NAD-dependent epimerase/dehydratase family protein [Qaidamihabitans albus]